MKLTQFKKFLESCGDAAFDGSCYTLATPAKRYLAEPPFPPPANIIFPPRPSLLAEHLATRPKIAVVLIRFGEYAIGLFEGTELVDYKTGKHFVRGRTKKGGSSSARYGRIRAIQRKEFMGKVGAALTSVLSMRKADYIFIGAAGDTARELLKNHPVPKKLVQPRTIAARHADFDALGASIEDVWSFDVKEI